MKNGALVLLIVCCLFLGMLIGGGLLYSYKEYNTNTNEVEEDCNDKEYQMTEVELSNYLDFYLRASKMSKEDLNDVSDKDLFVLGTKLLLNSSYKVEKDSNDYYILKDKLIADTLEKYLGIKGFLYTGEDEGLTYDSSQKQHLFLINFGLNPIGPEYNFKMHNIEYNDDSITLNVDQIYEEEYSSNNVSYKVTLNYNYNILSIEEL